MARAGRKGGSPDGSSAFFSNVPYTTTAGYLSKIFSKVAKVEHIELYSDSYGCSIGAGVVFFVSATAAQRAVSELHDCEVDGRSMLVKLNEREERKKGSGKGNPEAIVFFNGVPYDTSEGFLRAKFERHGRIVDFDLWRRPDGSSQGMGTCEFSDAAEAEGAITGLNGAVVDGRRILVQLDSRPTADGASQEPARSRRVGKGTSGKGNPERRVFWSNVPTTTTEGYLRCRFEQVGTIVDFDFWRRRDGSSLGMGVCEFDHYLGAWRAHERLHGMDIDGNSLLIKSDDGGRGQFSYMSGKAQRGKGKGKGAKY